MSPWLAAAALPLLAAAAADHAWPMQRRRFVAGLTSLVAAALLKSLLRGLRSRDFMESQRQAIGEGRDPFRDQPHGGHD